MTVKIIYLQVSIKNKIIFEILLSTKIAEHAITISNAILFKEIMTEHQVLNVIQIQL